MSAFYSLCYPDRVELLTDGAFYLEDGTLTKIMRKVWCSDNIPLAVTGRGSGAVEAFAIAIKLLSQCGSFDETLARTSEMLERRKPKGVPDDCEIVIAGISETSGPSIWYFATADAYGIEGFEPWTLYYVGMEWGGGSQLTAEEIAGMDVRGGLAECGVAIFEAMRRKPGPNPLRPDLPEIYGIGGHVDLTVIDGAGATTRRLHTWLEDEVGRKIDPVAG